VNALLRSTHSIDLLPLNNLAQEGPALPEGDPRPPANHQRRDQRDRPPPQGAPCPPWRAGSYGQGADHAAEHVRVPGLLQQEDLALAILLPHGLPEEVFSRPGDAHRPVPEVGDRRHHQQGYAMSPGERDDVMHVPTVVLDLDLIHPIKEILGHLDQAHVLKGPQQHGLHIGQPQHMVDGQRVVGKEAPQGPVPLVGVTEQRLQDRAALHHIVMGIEDLPVGVAVVVVAGVDDHQVWLVELEEEEQRQQAQGPEHNPPGWSSPRGNPGGESASWTVHPTPAGEAR